MQKPTLTYLHVRPGEDLPPIGQFPPFIAILVLDEVCEEMWRWDVSRQLAASHCRFLLAWGEYCEDWAESVEDAHLEAFDYGEVPAERELKTTTHEDEDLDEVFWFARHRARHPALQLAHTVVFHIAQQGRRDDIERRYAEA